MLISIDVPHFRCPDNIESHLRRVFNGEYDIPLIYTNKQPVVLDLGANFGAFSIWASHRWPGCKVHAFEPHPDTFSGLKENVRLYGNIYAHNYAVGEAGYRILFNGPENSGEASLYVQGNQRDYTGIHVATTDPLSLPEAHILKMDIEGCELEVLEPLMKAGRKFDAIMFEYHRKDDRLKLESLLGDYILTGANLYSPSLGVMRYLHKSLLP